MCRINHVKLALALRKLSSDIQIWTVFSALVFSIGLSSQACILFLFLLPHLFLLSFHFCLNTLSTNYSMNCILFVWFWHQWKPVSDDVSQIPNLLSDVVNHTHPPPSVSHSPLIRSCAQVLPESDLVFSFPSMLTFSASLSKSSCFACFFFHLPPHSSQFMTMTYSYSSFQTFTEFHIEKYFKFLYMDSDDFLICRETHFSSRTSMLLPVLSSSPTPTLRRAFAYQAFS